MTSTEDPYFVRVFLDPEQWFSIGWGLIADAKELEGKIHFHWEAAREAVQAAAESNGQDLRPIPAGQALRTYLMLIAYGIENIFKGVIVQNELEQLRDEVRDTHSIPNRLKSHKLRDLAGRAGISLDSTEEALLLRLTASAEWMGRYPVPISAKGLNNTPLRSGEYASQGYTADNDVETVNTFIDKLLACSLTKIRG